MQVWDYCWAWYFNHGVPGNLAASAITGALGYVIGRRAWRKHAKPVLTKVHELHAHLDPDNPFTLGSD